VSLTNEAWCFRCKGHFIVLLTTQLAQHRSNHPCKYNGPDSRHDCVGSKLEWHQQIAFTVLLFAPRVFAQESVFILDPAKSTVEFTLGASLHTVHGTFKVKSGEIHFDPAKGTASGAIVVDALSGESGN
jgi:hypothetical protein